MFRWGLIVMSIKFFFKSFFRQCFTNQRQKEASMRRSGYERRLKRYKKLLDEQNAVGYQRHFISSGRYTNKILKEQVQKQG